MITLRGTAAALLGFGLFSLDVALLSTFYAGQIDWQWALGTHLALCLAPMLPAFWLDQTGGRYGARLQLAVWMVLLGPFGVVIGMMLFLPVAAARTACFSEDGAVAPDRLITLHHDLLDGRLRLRGGHAIRPMLDILIEGDTPQKLDALSLIGKRYQPRFVPALRRALQDADGSVRVLAATVMAQLNNTHTRRIGALQDAVQDTPTAEAWRALGHARQAYAASGLLEAERAGQEADRAHECLNSAAAHGHSGTRTMTKGAVGHAY